MEKFNKNITSLFLPTINVLQELTRSAALLNYIHFNGKNLFSNNTTSKVNSVFDAFLTIEDPMAVFINNFEQFFAMYIHSKYGKNNFQIYMKECEKSPVSYPISVFEDSLCIFMQYNTGELRHYIYNILTMFYYYTGQNFYEMIRPNIKKTNRPNNIDENTEKNTNNNKEKRKHNSREAKLCFLNHRNYNVNKPYLRNKQLQSDTLTTGSHFEKCMLTSALHTGKHYTNILVGGPKKPIIEFDKNARIENNIIPTVKCNNHGINKDNKIFQLSEHLKKSVNFENNILNDKLDSEYTANNTYQHKESKTYVQTNFSQIWSGENRRQLVSLSIIYSVMNVCVQKITYSLIESKSRQTTTTGNNNTTGCDKIFKCVDNSNNNTIEYDYLNNEDEDNSDNIIFTESSSSKIKTKQIIKLKRPTIEISFNRESHKGIQQGLSKGNSCNFDSFKFSS